MRRTHTYTVAELELLTAAYDEIRIRLIAGGYEHAIEADGQIDMSGIGVTRGQDVDVTLQQRPDGRTRIVERPRREILIETTTHIDGRTSMRTSR